MNKHLLVVIGVVFIIAVSALFIILRPTPFTVGLQPGSVNYPMMYAIQGGFFEKEGLKPKVQVFRSANDALESILGGSVFIDSVIPIQNIATIENRQPGILGIAALLLSDSEHPLDYLVVPAKSSITTASELSGKTMVVFPGSYSETVTRLALSKIGITDVKFIKRAPADMPQALQTGDADAGILYDPIATQAEIQGWGKIIERAFWEKHLIPTIVVGAYTFNRHEAEKNPEIAKKVFKALGKAIRDARKDPRGAKEAVKAYLPTEQSIINKLPDTRVELASEIDPKLIDQTLELYAANGIISKVIDLRNLLHHPKH
jgi:ABC-type nitrate/sulfonate/bicarbonate transport system substrate-binding protein